MFFCEEEKVMKGSVIVHRLKSRGAISQTLHSLTLPSILRKLRRLIDASSVLLLAILMLPVVGHAQFSYIINTDLTVTITGYTGPDGPVTIPPTIKGLPVSAIGEAAFQSRSGLTSVNFPSNSISIGRSAFHG